MTAFTCLAHSLLLNTAVVDGAVAIPVNPLSEHNSNTNGVEAESTVTGIMSWLIINRYPIASYTCKPGRQSGSVGSALASQSSGQRIQALPLKAKLLSASYLSP